MPTYVYHCDTCNSNFEKVQRFSDDPLRNCPEGHDGVRRVITPSAIIFKGSGWYITDSKSGSGGGSATTPAPADKDAVKSGGTNGSEPTAKSEPKADTPSESTPAGKTEAA